MPAGAANLTIKAGFDYDRTLSDDTRTQLGTIRLKRGDASGGVNLALPLTSGDEDFLGAIGDLSANVGGGINHLSDFGTLKAWNAGLTWSPTGTLTFQASYLVNEAAPTLAQLGAPTILTYNVPVYDFTNATNALVTVTTGGNPDLVKEKQRDIKLSATWKLPFLERGNLMVEYFRNRSTNVTQSFPLLTPAIEAAFADRVTRDANGNLVAIDRRAVTFDEISSSRVRWGFNIGGRISGASSAGAPSAGARSAAPTPPAFPAAAPPESSGPGGPGAPAARPGFDPARFARLREAVCGRETPDLAALPDRMQKRLRAPDGSIDQAALAQLKQRMCSPGAAPAGARPVAPQTGAVQSAQDGGNTRQGGGAGGAPPMFGRGPGGGRWNLSLYHTWRFTDEVRIAPGMAVLDQLAGDALSSGGVPRHAIEAEGGVFLNGYGVRLKSQWQAPARVNGSGAPGSQDLRFGSTFVIDLRLFADLGRNEALVSRAPFLKGTRLALTVDNLLDSRQKVTNEDGVVPLAYQRAYRDPQGRVVGIDLRKMF